MADLAGTGGRWRAPPARLSQLRVAAPADSASQMAQSVEDITRILHEAQSPPAGPAGWDNDEYIDDAMDQEQYESSFDEWGMGTSI